MKIQSNLFKPNQPAFKQIYQLSLAKNCFKDKQGRPIETSLIAKEDFICSKLEGMFKSYYKKYLDEYLKGKNPDDLLDNLNNKNNVLAGLWLNEISSPIPFVEIVAEKPGFASLTEMVDQIGTYPLAYIINTINPNIKGPLNPKADTLYIYTGDHAKRMNDITSNIPGDIDSFEKHPDAQKSPHPKYWAITKAMEISKQRADKEFDGESVKKYLIPTIYSLKNVLNEIVEDSSKNPFAL